ncbi:hypothetical protein [Sporosarcina sp. D27]|uniref:hypothetical protein n=1 Tax=Sporosarcina sp. D27 TaxID=1382305 RepID=UPI00046F2D63|nr:hypothetical protein [Sporosarcina sp. D27]
MYFYAHLNNENICEAVSSTGEEIEDLKLIAVDSLDMDLLHRKYDSGTWSSDKYFSPAVSAPTIEEQILTENQYQTALLEMNMIGGM